jgi:hypothetical protein
MVASENALLSSYRQKCNLRRPSFYALINNFESFSPDRPESRTPRATNKVAGPATLFERLFHPLGPQSGAWIPPAGYKTAEPPTRWPFSKSEAARASVTRRARPSLFAPVYALGLGGLCVGLLNWHPSIPFIFAAAAWSVVNLVLGPISDKRILYRLITRELNDARFAVQIDQNGHSE